MPKLVGWSVLFIAIVAATLFAIENNHSVTLYFSIFSIAISLPLFILLWAFLGVGIVVAWIMAKRTHWQSAIELQRKDAHMNALKNEIQALRLEENYITTESDDDY